MPKYRVKVAYALWHFEEYEIDSEDFEEWDEEEFKDMPTDYCTEDDRVVNDTGDVVNGTWEETFVEIPVLDRIVDAVAKEKGFEVVTMKLSTMHPEDLSGLPVRVYKPAPWIKEIMDNPGGPLELH